MPAVGMQMSNVGVGLDSVCMKREIIDGLSSSNEQT